MKRRDNGRNDERERYEQLLEALYPLMVPFFDLHGKLELTHDDPSAEVSSLLAVLLDIQIMIHDSESARYFCADDVIARQVIVENDGLMRFWGIVWWLNTPSDYPINVTGKDPFYAEMRIADDQLIIETMKCGDYSLTNIDKTWWYNQNLDWIYEFFDPKSNR